MDKIKQLFSKENLLKFFFSFIWLAPVIFIADIISKWAVQLNLKSIGNSVTLIPNFLHVTLNHNLGASFGMGSSGEIGWRIFWISISVILSGVLVYVYKKYFAKFNRIQKAALALMIGGAVGNMIDRCFYWDAVVGFDGVIDWIDFQFGSYHFATFNIADSALVIGVLIVLALEIINLIKETIARDKRGEFDIPPLELEEKQKENADNKDE